MEILGLVNVNNWILALLFFCVSLLLYSKWKHSLFRRYGVPGPSPVPFFGVSLKYNRKGLALTDQDIAREYGDVVGVYMGHTPLLLVSNPETIKEIMVKEFARTPNRPKTFIARNELAHTLLNTDGDHWRFLRNTLLPTFSSGKMRMMEPLFKAKYEQLLDNLQEKAKSGKPIEFKEVFGAYTLDVIASTGFAVDIDSQKNPDSDFVKYAQKFFNITFNPLLLLILMFPKIDILLDWMGISPLNRRDIMAFFRSVATQAVDIRQEENSTRKDLLQMMLNAHRDTDINDNEKVQSYEEDPDKWKKRGLTMPEVLGHSILFMLVGYDTTSNALTFAAYNLATHPECQEKLIQEIDEVLGKECPNYDNVQKLEYLEKVFNESLRLYPSAARTNRLAEDDIVIEGYTIPKGTDISFPIYSIHRDPRYWENPTQFDPERFSPENKAKRHPYAFLPFGHGPRNCIGMRLAQVEMKFAMVYILQHFRFKTCAETEIPLTISKAGLIKPEHGVKLLLEPRS
ncbi:cytochrome P450 3A11-like isoform X1 [Crassostrea virginica]|uniref:Cytochrome P450 3A11-like isoform X1 n=2 Tax=Crassostrea virginica TaxID=6565 RepID=A0A8B8BN60_CRAVI|nr:cytochrome P450 3A11-like isoform X1 [Crassostrea virginica]